MTFDEATERYQKDPEFHNLVNVYYHFLYENKFTMGELRDALIFATNKFNIESLNRMSFEDWKSLSRRK